MNKMYKKWEEVNIQMIEVAPISKDAKPRPFRMFRRTQDFEWPPSSLWRIVKKDNAILEKNAFELICIDIAQHDGTNTHRNSVAAYNEMRPDGKGRYALLSASSSTLMV